MSTDNSNGNTGHDKYNSGAHFGADHERQSTSWTEALEPLVAAFNDGFLDDHLGPVVLAAVERRNHLSRFGLVAALPEPKTKTASPTLPVNTDLSPAISPLSSTARDAYISAFGNKYAKTDVMGAIATYKADMDVQGIRGIDGMKVAVTNAGRTKLSVKLLERPASGIRWQRAFDNKEEIAVSPENLDELFAR